MFEFTLMSIKVMISGLFGNQELNLANKAFPTRPFDVPTNYFH